MELHLDRKLAERRLFPAVDAEKSGTRKEELLLTPEELDASWLLRKAMSSLGPVETLELLLERLSNTKTNVELVELIRTSSFAENVRNK